MERAEDERLVSLRNMNIPIYSISRLGTFNGCLAEAYQTYVLKNEGRDNIYGILGTKVHDTLESIVNGTATEADLLPALHDELDDMDLLGIEFPKDSQGNDTLRKSWVEDMTHFCTTYTSPRDNLTTEQLFIYKTPKGRYLQGYIDLQRTNEDGSISIFDYKTSSMYSGEALKEHSYQILVYALGKMQEGYKVRDISWIFLKYCTIEFLGKKTVKSKEKTWLTKTIERRKIASEMTKHVEQDLYNIGIDGIEAEVILHEFAQTNKFDCLPEEIREHYIIKPCIVSYELSEQTLQDCIDYIDGTIDMWEALDKNDVNVFKPRNFTRAQKNGKTVDDIFYCTNLCGHFKTCTYIHDYLDSKQQDSDDDIF